MPTEERTILVVDDEPYVRDVIRDFLTSAGYVVLEAASGAEALERARRHHGPIGLLITDMAMPGMKGLELSRHLTLQRPETKVLYMSGTEETTLIRRSSNQGTAFLWKPFRRDALLGKVKEVLERV